MTANGWLQIGLFFVVLLAVTKPLGVFMARVFAGEKTFLDPVLRPIERLIYRLCGIDDKREMEWKEYTVAMLLFSVVSMLVLYLIERVQQWLPWNPQHMAAVPAALAFNTAASFTTNTNWQNYGGESTMSYFTQMAGLAYHNFVSAGVGIALAIAVIRGIARKESKTIGNFWVDVTRCMLWVLLPACLVIAMVFVSQGMIQNLRPYDTAKLLNPQTVQTTGADGKITSQTITDQVIAQGPFASQEAIKIFGTNGGGPFNTNSAHPFENPNPLTDFMQIVMMLALGSGLTYTLGRMTGSQKHGWAVWSAMAILCLAGVTVAYSAEARGNPLLQGIDQHTSAVQPGGNMEGKEVRFGIASTALFATTTTDASCGAVNGMHDSFTPLGGMVPLVNIMIGEVIFGGVGAGLYGMVVFIILSVFIAGLMVGRTPEYLGKKIEAYDVKMAMVTVLIFCLLVLGLTGIRDCVPVWHIVHFECRSTRPDASSVRLHFAGGQQRLGVRRAEREYALVQHQRRFRHAVRAVLHGDSGARTRRKSGAQEACARIRRHLSCDDATIHVPADIRDLDCQRTYIFPGAQPGPDSRAPADARRKGILRRP